MAAQTDTGILRCAQDDIVDSPDSSETTSDVDKWKEGVMFLGVDCGTQGTKALLVSSAGQALGRGYAKHPLIERVDGTREQEPAWWVSAMITAVRAALADAAVAGADVQAMGVSGQQHGLTVLDEHAAVIRPAKLWNDTSTAEANRTLLDAFGGAAEWSQRFGVVPLTGYTVSKLLWLRENEPGNFARVRHILLPHEYLNWWLTGEFRAEPGDASGTAFFDNRTCAWLPEVLAAVDGGSGQLAAALPRLVDSTECLGTLRRAAADQLGLSSACLVSAGGGDNMMGAIGTGNVREGVVTLSLGTSSTVYSFSSTPINDPTGQVAPFCSSSGGWLPLVCTMNATNVVTATVELVGKRVEDIEAALESTPPGAHGLCLLPFLNGERTPDLPHARGSLHGVSAMNYTPDHLIRAAIEGVSFGILHGLDLILRGRPADVLQVIGGGARSRAWRQLLADCTGARVEVPAEREAGCLGAAIQACVAYDRQLGGTLAFIDAAEAFARPQAESMVVPRSEFRAAYRQARTAYREELRRQHGI